MKRRNAFFATASLGLLLTLGSAPGTASAQDTKTVAGTYSAVASGGMDSSGKRRDTYGENPLGQLILTPDGRYSLTLVRRGLPKFAAGARTKGTAEENGAVVNGSINHYGTYKVGDGGKTITFNIEASTFPNWNGTSQTRPFTLKDGVLTYKVANSSGGGSGEVVWRRVK